MPRIKLTKKTVLEKKVNLIAQLSKEGFTDIEIGEIFNIDRTWVYRIRKYHQDKRRV